MGRNARLEELFWLERWFILMFHIRRCAPTKCSGNGLVLGDINDRLRLILHLDILVYLLFNSELNSSMEIA